MKFIDHEPNNFVVFLGDHADAIALPQTTNKVFFVPSKLETLVFDTQHGRHITANHPTDVNARGGWIWMFHLGLLFERNRATSGLPLPWHT